MSSPYVLPATLLVSAGAFAAAVTRPAPVLDGGGVDGELVWDLARLAVLPAGMLWIVALGCPGAATRVLAASCAMAASAALWVLRAPRPGDADDSGHDDGGHPPPDPPGPPPGGRAIDWEAFERAAHAAWREQREPAGR